MFQTIVLKKIHQILMTRCVVCVVLWWGNVTTKDTVAQTERDEKYVVCDTVHELEHAIMVLYLVNIMRRTPAMQPVVLIWLVSSYLKTFSTVTSEYYLILHPLWSCTAAVVQLHQIRACVRASLIRYKGSQLLSIFCCCKYACPTHQIISFYGNVTVID